VRAVVALNHVVTRQVFKRHSGRAPVDLHNRFLQVEDVQVRQPGSTIPEGSIHLASEGDLKNVKAVHCSVYVRQAFIVMALHQLKDAPRDEEGLELL
jgi:hypothetical protein